jgi:DNA-directed RNA polymerase II subunit RPB1
MQGDLLNHADGYEAIEFYVLGDEDIKRTSTAQIYNTAQFSDKKPIQDGLYDPRMGTVSLHYDCAICCKKVDECPGHNSYYALQYPYTQFIYSKYVYKNICIVCIHCHKYLMNPDLQFKDGTFVYQDHPKFSKNHSYNDILSYIYDKKTAKSRKAIYCDYCNQIDVYLREEENLKKYIPRVIQPAYTKTRLADKSEKFDKLLVIEEKTEFQTELKKYVVNTKLKRINEYAVLLFPEDCKKRFEMLPDSELVKHGIDKRTHPKNFIVYNLLIPPVNIRHVNRKGTDIYNNFITDSLATLITIDKQIDRTVTYHDAANFAIQLRKIADVADKYNSYISAPGVDEGDTASIIKEVKGKQGILRNRILGKLLSHVFRCVIACNVGNDIDVIGIPKSFGQIMHLEETVTPYNITRLQKYVDNGNQYPGCNKIKIANQNYKCVINKGDYKLQFGDIVSRNIINNDEIPITRFPSLFVTSTINVRTIIHNKKKDNNATDLNVITCAPLNGDFDGDTISSFYIVSESVRAEFSILANIRRNFTSGIDGTAIYGQAQDTIAGCGFLTLNSTVLNIQQVKHILNGVPINVQLENRNYSGRELFSIVLPRLSLEVPSPFFKNKLIEFYGTFDDNDKIVRIVDGKLISGIVCDSLIKIGKKNTIYHIIYNYYGADVALKVIRYHQIIILNFIKLFGITLDYNSFEVNQKAKDTIGMIQSSVLYKVEEINRKLMNNEIMPPSGISMYDHVENLITTEYRSIGQKYIGAILSSIDIKKNWLLQMCLMGSKGSLDNIEKMLAVIGQVYLYQKRVPFLLDFRRTSIWSHQFDLSPESRGYVPDSYSSGYDLQGTYTLGREARNNILTKGLVTAEAGTEGRNVIKNSETLLVDNRLFVSREYGCRIFQFSPGDDLINHKELFPSKYVLYNKDDKFIKQNYHANLVDLLINERNEFISNSLFKEQCNISFLSSADVLSPLNMPQIIDIILGAPSEKTKPADSLSKTLATMINNYCDTLHHKRFNDLFVKQLHERKMEIPEAFQSAFITMKLLIRSTFDNSVIDRILRTKDPITTMSVILAKVTNQIILNFVEPGLAYGIYVSLTTTSPFTQYLIDAHHVSASGGTSRDDIKQFKSIIYLKPIASMHLRKTYVFLLPEYEQNKDHATKLANYIETQALGDYLLEIRMLCEDPDSFITFPADALEIRKSVISQGIDHRRMRNFVFRMVLNSKKMLSKNVNIENMFEKLDTLFNKEICCAYRSTESEYIVYMYFEKTFAFDVLDKKSKQQSGKMMAKIVGFGEYLRDSFIINSFDNLKNVKVRSQKRSILDSGKLSETVIYYIEADGINLRDIYLINVVDKTRTFCNNIQEVYKYCGFVDARNRIIDILNSIFKPSLDMMITNYLLIADLMMELGLPTGLTVSGLSKREENDCIVTAAYKNPLDSLCDAAINGTTTKIISPSSSLVMGQMPKMGSLYNMLMRNPDYKTELDDVENIL